MNVVNAEQAKAAEEAGATIMALERVPADIRAIVEEVAKAVSIPVMAKARIGHIVETRVLESLGVDYIDDRQKPLLRQLHVIETRG